MEYRYVIFSKILGENLAEFIIEIELGKGSNQHEDMILDSDQSQVSLKPYQ